jgi:hypothetical protein
LGGGAGRGLHELRLRKLGFLRTETLYAARIAFVLESEDAAAVRARRLAGTPVLLVMDIARLLDAVEGGSLGDCRGLPGVSLEPDVLVLDRAGSCTGGRTGEGDREPELFENEVVDPGPVVTEAQSLCEERSVWSAAVREDGRVIGKAFRKSSGSWDGVKEATLSVSVVSGTVCWDKVATRPAHTARFSSHECAYSMTGAMPSAVKWNRGDAK